MGTRELAEFISSTEPPAAPESKESKAAWKGFLRKTYPKGVPSPASNLQIYDEFNSGNATSEPVLGSDTDHMDSKDGHASRAPEDLRGSGSIAKAHKVLGKKEHDEAKALRVLGESRARNQVIPPPQAECLPDKRKRRNPIHKIQKILGLKKHKKPAVSEPEQVRTPESPEEIQKPEEQLHMEEPLGAEVEKGLIEPSLPSPAVAAPAVDQGISTASLKSVSRYSSEAESLELEEMPAQGPLPEEPMGKLIYRQRTTPIMIRLYRYGLKWYDWARERWNR